MTVLTTKDTKITKLFFSVIFLCDLYELYDEKTNFFSKFTIIFKKLFASLFLNFSHFAVKRKDSGVRRNDGGSLQPLNLETVVERARRRCDRCARQ
ncbi:MAG TPA: hypothetical protein DCM27_00005, partial [Rhodospirillaceae bacterium]|nr:hypothetical protein [Rhodospirillaceae bacterium]